MRAIGGSCQFITAIPKGFVNKNGNSDGKYFHVFGFWDAKFFESATQQAVFMLSSNHGREREGIPFKERD